VADGHDGLPRVSPGIAYSVATLATIIWGSPPVVTRAVSGDVPPLALAFSRWAIATLVLLPIVRPKLMRDWPKIRAHFGSLALLAAFMTAGSSLSVVAPYFTTATNAVLVNASQPAITAVIAWLVAREALTARQSLGVGFAFLGILAMIGRADINVLLALDINIGDLIMLGAVIGWSLYAVKLHRRDYLPRGDVLLFFISVVGTLFLLPLFLVEMSVRGPFEPRLEVGAAMVFLALFPTLLATYVWNLAIRSIGANRAAIFINLIPVSGAVLAMVFLGERLFAYHLIGAALVFTGIYFATRG
jgi:drug/metabolite transporter (DMT)-like permease